MTLLANEAILLTKLDQLDEAQVVVDKGRALLRPADDAASAALHLAQARISSQRQDYAAAGEQAQLAFDILLRTRGQDDIETAWAESILGASLISQSKFPEGLKHTGQAWDVCSRKLPAGDADRIDVGFQHAIGLVYSRQAKEAEAMLRTLADEGPLLPQRHPYRAKLPNLLGTELLMQGRINESIPWLRKSVDLGAEAGTQILGERADNLGALGIALLMADRPTEALPVIEASIGMFADAGATPSQAGAYINAGTAADRAGDRPRGLELREKGMALLAQLSAQSELATALNRFKLAQSYAHVGRLEEAEAMERQAVDVLTRLRPETHFQNTNSRISLGWITALRGRTAEGLDMLRKAFRTSVSTNDALEVSRNQVVGVLDNIEAYSQALQTAVLADDREFAFEVLQVMVETDASRAAIAVAAREEAGDTDLGKLLRQRQEGAVAVAEANAELLAAQSSDAKDGLEDRTVRLAAAEAALAALDSVLDDRFPKFRDLLRPRAVSLSQTQARLNADETLLVVEESDLGIYTMAITREQVAIGHSPIRREALRTLVSRIRSGIDDGDPAKFDVAAAATLHDAVFTPAIRPLARKGQRLRLVTGDILSALPFSVLASKAGKSAADTRWLIEDHAISVLPSITAMQRDDAGLPLARRFVGIGAPVLGLPRSDTSSPSRAGALAPLPGATRELAQVARLLGRDGTATEILEGSAATEAAVRAMEYSDVGVLLFATHGLVAGRFDGDSEPALVLTPPTDAADGDGLLTASEAAGLRIGADWVILSACDTAGGNHPSAAGYTGLARAFLFAGARRVVASHWPVRDDVSARLSVGIVTAARKGLAPDEALRRSILSLMRDRSVPDSRDPANWAPFMVVAR